MKKLNENNTLQQLLEDFKIAKNYNHSDILQAVSKINKQSYTNTRSWDTLDNTYKVTYDLTVLLPEEGEYTRSKIDSYIDYKFNNLTELIKGLQAIKLLQEKEQKQGIYNILATNVTTTMYHNNEIVIEDTSSGLDFYDSNYMAQVFNDNHKYIKQLEEAMDTINKYEEFLKRHKVDLNDIK